MSAYAPRDRSEVPPNVTSRVYGLDRVTVSPAGGTAQFAIPPLASRVAVVTTLPDGSIEVSQNDSLGDVDAWAIENTSGPVGGFPWRRLVPAAPGFQSRLDLTNDHPTDDANVGAWWEWDLGGVW